MTILILFLTALGSSIISGLVGMAGGVTLLAVMTFFFPMHVIVPVHGLVQFVSNSSRTWILREHVHRESFVPFLIGVPIGGVAVWFFLSNLDRPEWILGIVAALLFYVAFKPKKLPELKLGTKGFWLLGVAASFLGSLVGATGPLMAPFFARSDFTKEQIVATKAACQLLVHIVKVPIFLGLAFPYQDYWLETAVMVVGVIIGTKLGTSLLKSMSTQRFMILLKVALALTGLRITIKMLTSS
ncbi:sulfite exporter TauE/SafE family protein [Pseudobacteriovorax antillogorgiicola]|uniref:Probable membrane transporter protein n=1 Tax=Pseudobacteriovorax antillogorgiicola TaxID=1513793 RepID=A0A1Y6BVL1_9BACT|nr:sulfite exporter TauE/SafE family protein [Pseudobacteriovorax antillogorgiicola]TCS52974.1 putative membrane protein YfcA [Pseudobacteriovorax antillogorgiicola]SMF27412.1 Uncharacterized membrane protein YfcA [Pseudobacteriovorax antillogorgiicola]